MCDRLITLLYECRSIEGVGMELVEKQADYLLANGVIAPPCKVGDTVYYINLYNHIMLYKHEVYEAEVVRLVVTRYGVSPVIRVKSVYSTYEIPGVEFGKNVFLTREEAEQVLAERKVL